MDIVTIGRCHGCDRMRRLDAGVCTACLERRGRRWAELSHRCRKDRSFAFAVYRRIRDEHGRALFRRMYGDPTPRPRDDEDDAFIRPPAVPLPEVVVPCSGRCRTIPLAESFGFTFHDEGGRS